MAGFDGRALWFRARGVVFLVTIGVLLAFQLVFDVFSNFVGGGMTLFGDLVLGGIVLFLAYKSARPPPTPQQWAIFGAIALLLALQVWLDWQHRVLSGALIVITDIVTGLCILFLVYRMPRLNRARFAPIA